MTPLSTLSHFLHCTISGMSLRQVPDFFFLHHLLCRENPDIKRTAEITTRKHNLEDNALWRALFLTAGPRRTNCQQRRKKLVSGAKKTPQIWRWIVFLKGLSWFICFYYPSSWNREFKRGGEGFLSVFYRLLNLFKDYYFKNRTTFYLIVHSF